MHIVTENKKVINNQRRMRLNQSIISSVNDLIYELLNV